MSNEIAGLTRHGVYVYAAILDGCDNERRCKWEDAEHNVHEGTMRHLVGFSDEDIREARVRITSTTGCEYDYAIRTIAEKLRDGLFFIK